MSDFLIDRNFVQQVYINSSLIRPSDLYSRDGEDYRMTAKNRSADLGVSSPPPPPPPLHLPQASKRFIFASAFISPFQLPWSLGQPT